MQKYQQELNAAKTSVLNTQNQLKQINGELKKHGVNWGDVGNAVAKGAQAFGKGIIALGTAAGTAATALAGCTVSAASYADNILTLSANTHIATDDLRGEKREAKTRRIGEQRFSIPKEMAAAFKAKCIEKGIPQAQVIKAAINQFLAE